MYLAAAGGNIGEIIKHYSQIWAYILNSDYLD